MTNNKRKELCSEILSSILAYGTETSKGDILSDEPMEEKVYTKRINIGKDYGVGPNAVEIVCVSLTSADENWDGIKFKVKDVRINTKNSQGKWCNIFVNEAPTEMLSFIHENIKV